MREKFGAHSVLISEKKFRTIKWFIFFLLANHFWVKFKISVQFPISFPLKINTKGMFYLDMVFL